jgi:hypothetical protein
MASDWRPCDQCGGACIADATSCFAHAGTEEQSGGGSAGTILGREGPAPEVAVGRPEAGRKAPAGSSSSRTFRSACAAGRTPPAAGLSGLRSRARVSGRTAPGGPAVCGRPLPAGKEPLMNRPAFLSLPSHRAGGGSRLAGPAPARQEEDATKHQRTKNGDAMRRVLFASILTALLLGGIVTSGGAAQANTGHGCSVAAQSSTSSSCVFQASTTVVSAASTVDLGTSWQVLNWHGCNPTVSSCTSSDAVFTGIGPGKDCSAGNAISPGDFLQVTVTGSATASGHVRASSVNRCK